MLQLLFLLSVPAVRRSSPTQACDTVVVVAVVVAVVVVAAVVAVVLAVDIADGNAAGSPTAVDSCCYALLF